MKPVRDDNYKNILAIVNEVGTTWKVKRALLRNMGVSETVINILVPEEKPSDY